eukprot:gene9232-9397_t
MLPVVTAGAAGSDHALQPTHTREVVLHSTSNGLAPSRGFTKSSSIPQSRVSHDSLLEGLGGSSRKVSRCSSAKSHRSSGGCSPVWRPGGSRTSSKDDGRKLQSYESARRLLLGRPSPVGCQGPPCHVAEEGLWADDQMRLAGKATEPSAPATARSTPSPGGSSLPGPPGLQLKAMVRAYDAISKHKSSAEKAAALAALAATMAGAGGVARSRAPAALSLMLPVGPQQQAEKQEYPDGLQSQLTDAGMAGNMSPVAGNNTSGDGDDESGLQAGSPARSPKGAGRAAVAYGSDPARHDWRGIARSYSSSSSSIRAREALVVASSCTGSSSVLQALKSEAPVWQRPSAERQAAHVQLLSTPMHKRAGSYAAGLAVITGGSNRSLQRLSGGSKVLQAGPDPEQEWDDAQQGGSAIAEGTPDMSGLQATEPISAPAGNTCCHTLLLRDTATGGLVLHHHPGMTVQQALQWLQAGLIRTSGGDDEACEGPAGGQQQNLAAPPGADQQQTSGSPRSPRGRARSRPCSPFWCFSQSSQTWSDDDEDDKAEDNDRKEKGKEDEPQPQQLLSSSIKCDKQTLQHAAVRFELQDNQLFLMASSAPQQSPAERHLVTGVVLPGPHNMAAGSNNMLELVTPAMRHQVQLASEYDWTGLLAAQLAEELQHARAGSGLRQAVNSSRHNAAGLGQGPAYPAFVSLLGQDMPAHPKSSTSNICDAERPSESATISHQAAALRCQSLEAEVQLWKAKHVDAVQDLERCQASYMRREAQLKAELDRQQHQQQGQGCNSPAADAGSICASGCEGSAKGQQTQKPPTFSEMQQQVLQGLDDLLEGQKLQMQAEEAQQLRHFRSKLSEIEGQLQADKQVAAAHQDGWMAKTVALRDELTRTQEIASKLDAMYKLAEEEAVQLRVQFKAQEDDRQHLIRQLLMYKRDNNRLKQQLKTVEEELDAVIVLSADAAEAVPELHNRNDLASVVSQVAERRGRGAAGCSRWHITDFGAAGPSCRPQSAAPGSSRHHAGSEGPTLRPWSAAAASRPFNPPPGDMLSPNMDAASVAVKMQRYSHVIQKLQKLLECERRQLRQVRQSYASELSRRTELQTLLLDSIQQAKQQYRHAELASHAAVKQGGCGLAPATASSSADKAWCKPRPGTASAACSTSTSRCRAWQRPSSAANHALSAPLGSDPPLTQQSWDVVLDKVLAKQELLEMLFDKMFPEFMAGAADGEEEVQNPLVPYTQRATAGQLPAAAVLGMPSRQAVTF